MGVVVTHEGDVLGQLVLVVRERLDCVLELGNYATEAVLLMAVVANLGVCSFRYNKRQLKKDIFRARIVALWFEFLLS